MTKFPENSIFTAQLYNSCHSLSLLVLAVAVVCLDSSRCLSRSERFASLPSCSATCRGETKEKSGGETKTKRDEKEDREAQGYRDGEKNIFRGKKMKNWQQKACS